MYSKNMILLIATLTPFQLTANEQQSESPKVFEPMVINADLRDISKFDIAASVSAFDELDLQDRGASHFEDVLLQIPNMNYSAEGSRPRHLQIRGMGERDEYTGAPNASVGFAIDGIDFSGIGLTGNLFDVEQVEVLRGPQGTRYGANALAGLVNIKTNDPTPYRESLLELSAGQDDLTELGLMTSGAFNEDNPDSPQYRFALFKHDSDGFRDNNFLDRDDTNSKDELFVRGKLRFFLSDSTRLDLTLMHADIDNGYDAYSLDNDFSTETDEPGRDQQKSNAAAVKLTMDGSPLFTFTSTTTIADSNITYGYDADWVDPTYWDDPFVYNYENRKERDTLSQEFRFVSKPEARIFADTTDWLFGFYFAELDEKNAVDEEFVDNFGTPDSMKRSEFESTNIAFFGQLDYQWSTETTLSGGLRVERNNQDFESNLDEDFSPSENLFGGHISLSHEISSAHKAYAAISRGYKAGGFNTGLSDGTDSRFLRYEKETALNYEMGLKSNFLNDTLKTSLSVFYMDRKDPQFDGYSYIGPNYVFFTENLDEAENYGIEAEAEWQATDSLKLFVSLGLLETKVEGQPLNSAFVMSGREQAHAPSYQYNVGAQYRGVSGLFARVDVTGVDSFYFDNVHNFKSDNYTLTNLRVGYEFDDWEIYLWGRNIFDQKYATRGFFFANDPDYGFGAVPEREFIQLGDPRQFGITTRIRF